MDIQIDEMKTGRFPSKIRLWISQVSQGDFTRQVRDVGLLATSKIRWIAANTAGRVERIFVKPNALVSRTNASLLLKTLITKVKENA